MKVIKVIKEIKETINIVKHQLKLDKIDKHSSENKSDDAGDMINTLASTGLLRSAYISSKGKVYLRFKDDAYNGNMIGEEAYTIMREYSIDLSHGTGTGRSAPYYANAKRHAVKEFVFD
jgi:hypothetical protein